MGTKPENQEAVAAGAAAAATAAASSAAAPREEEHAGSDTEAAAVGGKKKKAKKKKKKKKGSQHRTQQQHAPTIYANLGDLDTFKITTDAVSGRCVVASRDLEAGELVLHEPPFAKVGYVAEFLEIMMISHSLYHWK